MTDDLDQRSRERARRAETEARRQEVLDASHDLLEAALDAHISVRVGWPHAARRAARAVPDAASRVVIALSAWCASQPESVEDEERRTSHELALDVLIARASAKRTSQLPEEGDPR